MRESIKNCSTAQKNKKDVACTHTPSATEPHSSWKRARYIATKFSKFSFKFKGLKCHLHQGKSY